MQREQHVIFSEIDAEYLSLSSILGCFLNAYKQPVQRLAEPFVALCSSDVAELDALCIESYVHKVLQVDLNYFDNPKNIERFEQKINGKVPDFETIEYLRDWIKSYSNSPIKPAATITSDGSLQVAND